MEDKNVLIEITSSPINLDRLMDFVNCPEAGAVSTFSGNTRNNFKGKKVCRRYIDIQDTTYKFDRIIVYMCVMLMTQIGVEVKI